MGNMLFEGTGDKPGIRQQKCVVHETLLAMVLQTTVQKLKKQITFHRSRLVGWKQKELGGRRKVNICEGISMKHCMPETQ